MGAPNRLSGLPAHHVRLLAPIAAVLFVLTGCGGGDTGDTTPTEQSQSAGSSRSPDAEALTVHSSAANVASTPSACVQVSISSYDIARTPESGYGGWFHTYSGTIESTGRTLSTSASGPARILNYAGGSGTLNDAVTAPDVSNNHLLNFGNADDGSPIDPLITLHLAGTHLIRSIKIYGGDVAGNLYPGALDGLTVEFGGTSIAVTTTPVGPPGAIGTPVDDVIDLSGTALAAIPTDRIVLRNFTSSIFGFALDQVSIGEVTVERKEDSSVQDVIIDIKPGDTLNVINTKSKGRIPVAVLSTATFNAVTTVNTSSLTFGHAGDEQSLSKCVVEDVNADALADLLCFFDNQQAAFQSTDVQGLLRGRTNSCLPIQGTAPVHVIQ